MGKLKGTGRNRPFNRLRRCSWPGTLAERPELRGPFDERHLVVEPPTFGRPQARISKNVLGRLAEPTLAEKRNTARQAHSRSLREIEDIVTDLQKQTENFCSAGNRHRAAVTADRSARLFQCRAGGVPEPCVRTIGLRRKVGRSPR